MLRHLKMRENICGKMTDILSLPRDVMLEILTFLPYNDLISVERTCQHWCDLSKDNKIRGRLATGIQSIWDDRTLKEAYFPSIAEVLCAASLAATGHLTSAGVRLWSAFLLLV